MLHLSQGRHRKNAGSSSFCAGTLDLEVRKHRPLLPQSEAAVFNWAVASPVTTLWSRLLLGGELPWELLALKNQIDVLPCLRLCRI